MSVTLTFLGRSCDRWRVRVELDDPSAVRGLTVSLVAENGRPLGPAVVAPADIGVCWVADIRGPPHLPPGTIVRATADGEWGVVQEEIGVDPRRGLHAFLHADARLPLDNKPRGAALSGKETARLGRLFPWMCGCAPPTPVDEDEVSALLREMGVNPGEVDPDLVAELRKGF